MMVGYWRIFHRRLQRIEETLRVDSKNAFSEAAVGNFLLIKAENVKGKQWKDSDWFGELLEAIPK